MALTKTQAKVLSYLESNGPATIYGVSAAFGFGHNASGMHLRKLKEMKKVHSPGFDMTSRDRPVRLFKAGIGEDTPFCLCPNTKQPEQLAGLKKEVFDFIQSGPKTITEIKNKFGMRKQSARSLIKALEEKNLAYLSGYKNAICGRNKTAKTYSAGPNPEGFVMKEFDDENFIEEKEIAKIRSEALENAQMLLNRTNTVFGWLLERNHV